VVNDAPRPPLVAPGRALITSFPVLTTERLRMRAWRDEDIAPFAALNADPRVMEFFPEPYGYERTERFVAVIRERWEQLKYSLWAVERLDTGSFIGYVGLWPAIFAAPFTPAVEVGWRLAAEHWGHGFATEAGRAALSYAFGPLGFEEIVSFTSAINVRSWRVMERLGMTRDTAGDFDHPSNPEGHRLRRHVLYRIRSAPPTKDPQ
jgi:RimJ/RimL family protein N-acetyltransferase